MRWSTTVYYNNIHIRSNYRKLKNRTILQTTKWYLATAGCSCPVGLSHSWPHLQLHLLTHVWEAS